MFNWKSSEKIVNKDIFVWFSCGAASAVAAKIILDLYGDKNNIKILNNPIKEEHHDNKRFLQDLQSYLNHTIISVTNPDFPEQSAQEVWERKKFMSGVYGAPCTTLLKKRARQFYERDNNCDFIVMGFTSEEQKRVVNFRNSELIPLLTPLLDNNMTKVSCADFLISEGLKLPEIYKLGFPNANCIGCVKASSPTYWNHVRKTFPDVFESRLETEEKLGSKLVIRKGKRITLKELSPHDKGRSMKSLKSIECGVLCSTEDII